MYGCILILIWKPVGELAALPGEDQDAERAAASLRGSLDCDSDQTSYSSSDRWWGSDFEKGLNMLDLMTDMVLVSFSL